MKVSLSTLTIEGAELNGANPLPIFRNRKHHREVNENGSLKQEQKQKLGYEAGERYLPYRVQDRYSRERRTIRQKTIVLENDKLRAVFLPDYGGRLYSLLEKKTGREILYKNPVFQPANLAILNAWFSGGIEWNIGQLGHTFTTCSPVHAAKLKDDEGNEFLRLFEYERCKNVFWHIDFHLPRGAEQLQVYVRIINDNNKLVPMYWWTNIAVDETKEARVFSSSHEVIYLDNRIKGFGFDRMPYLPLIPEIDASYPIRIPFASEYFFQTPQSCKSPWEAVVYEDGRMFFERSTSRLRYRKMFCWGSHTGGRRWCDFLAKPGEGNYIEVQGGFAPTQLHGLDMPAGTEWDFTQMIGVLQVNNKLPYDNDWNKACNYVETQIDNYLSDDEVYRIHSRLQTLASKQVSRILSTGSGWGALEAMRREAAGEKAIPQGFCFAEASIGKEQYPWIALLQEGHLPDTDVRDIPESWMIQDEWMEMLEKSLLQKENQAWNSYMHLGVMLYEKDMEDRAFEAWENSLKIKPSSWVYRNLAAAMIQRNENDKAVLYMEKAFKLHNQFPDMAFAEEYLNLLIEKGDYEKAWEVYETLPEGYMQSDRIRIIVGKAALELGKDDFVLNLFNTEFAVIREGETLIVDLWFRYNARKLARERNAELTEDLVKEAVRDCPPPACIDFRVL